MFASAGATIALILSAAALLGLCARAWVKWGNPLRLRLRAGLDSLVGRDEIRDTITNEVLSPALPGIGVRMHSTEHAVELLTETVSKLVDHQQSVVLLAKRVDQHETRLTKLETAPTVVSSPTYVQVGDRQ